MNCKLGFASFSFGAIEAGHALETKIKIAHEYGYQGVEIDYADLQAIASRNQSEDSKLAELHAAQHVRKLCKETSMSVICLQSFLNVGGLIDSQQHKSRMKDLYHWIDICHALGTDMIQIPSSFLPEEAHFPDEAEHIKDFREIADVGLVARPVVRFAFEALCWGPQCQFWEDSWRIVQAVDRSNFGMCLDTFHIAGRVYADPSLASGRTVDAEQAIAASMRRLVEEVDVHKVFYVQVEDGERLETPLIKGHPLYEADVEPRRLWQRNCRLFYGETDRGGYLPIRDLVKAIFHGLKYKGWVSWEIFHGIIMDKDESVPEEMAKRGKEAWTRLMEDIVTYSI